MIDRRITLSLPALLTFFLCGCSSSPTKFSEYSNLDNLSQKFVEIHMRLARKHEADGAVNEALREWQLIDAVMQPNSSSARVEIARLEQKVSTRVQKHIQAAHGAERRGDYTTARMELLKALALKPYETRAIKKLKELEKRRSYTSLALLPIESEVIENEADHYTSSSISSRIDDHRDRISASLSKKSNSRAVSDKAQSNKEVRKYETTGINNSFQRGLAHWSRKEYKHALQYFLIARRKDEGKQKLVDKFLARTRRALAKQHYEQGVIAFRAARYDQAVNEFEQALEYAPEHKKARLYHSSAKTLQRR